MTWREPQEQEHVQNKNKNTENKDLRTLPEVLKQLDNLHKNKKGEIISKPAKLLAEEEAKHLEDLKLQQQEYQMKLDAMEAERQALLEEESSDTKIENDKSKQKKVKKAKILDPVNEQEKIKRREERIKVLIILIK